MKLEPSLQWVDRSKTGVGHATIRKVELVHSDRWDRDELRMHTDRGVLTLNSGNKNRCIELFGYETDDWIGKAILIEVKDGKLLIQARHYESPQKVTV